MYFIFELADPRTVGNIGFPFSRAERATFYQERTRPDRLHGVVKVFSSQNDLPGIAIYLMAGFMSLEGSPGGINSLEEVLRYLAGLHVTAQQVSLMACDEIRIEDGEFVISGEAPIINEIFGRSLTILQP